MSNIIQLSHYQREKREDTFMLTGLAKEISDLNRAYREKGEEIGFSEIQRMIRMIFAQIGDFYSKKEATPIIQIAKSFGFKAYRETMDITQSGDIQINGDTERIYKHNKVITVNRNDHLYHQRFVVAHELAHYLLDFLGNDTYELNPEKKFSEAYFRDQHDNASEERANYFAAEIMMPRELFIEQYNVAKRIAGDRLTMLSYLSHYFETTEESIVRRIEEVSINGR